MIASTQDSVLLFPSEAELFTYLNHHPKSNHFQDSYLTERKIIRVVANAFACKALYAMVVNMRVEVTLRSINLAISGADRSTLVKNLTIALIDCANGKPIPKDVYYEFTSMPLH